MSVTIFLAWWTSCNPALCGVKDFSYLLVATMTRRMKQVQFCIWFILHRITTYSHQAKEMSEIRVLGTVRWILVTKIKSKEDSTSSRRKFRKREWNNRSTSSYISLRMTKFRVGKAWITAGKLTDFNHRIKSQYKATLPTLPIPLSCAANRSACQFLFVGKKRDSILESITLENRKCSLLAAFSCAFPNATSIFHLPYGTST